MKEAIMPKWWKTIKSIIEWVFLDTPKTTSKQVLKFWILLLIHGVSITPLVAFPQPFFMLGDAISNFLSVETSTELLVGFGYLLLYGAIVFAICIIPLTLITMIYAYYDDLKIERRTEYFRVEPVKHHDLLVKDEASDFLRNWHESRSREYLEDPTVSSSSTATITSRLIPHTQK